MKAIAALICKTLKNYNIPLEDCPGQGYDNGTSMSGKCEGRKITSNLKISMQSFRPVDSVECCPRVINFFGVVQKCFNIFSSSTQRWEILKSKIPNSLHCLSNTRWSARIDATKPFAKNLHGLINDLKKVKKLNFTAKTRRDVNGI